MTTCTHCGRDVPNPCRNTRDMEDAPEAYCFTALMFAGGGERSGNQAQAAIFRRGAYEQNDNPAKAARIKELEAALRPFADRCDAIVHEMDAEDDVFTVAVSHLRTARSVLGSAS